MIPYITCGICADDDPHVRTRHHFDWMERGLDAFRDHLETAYAARQSCNEEVNRTVGWAAGLIEMYSGFVDPDTGERLTWRQTRTMMLREQPVVPQGVYPRGNLGAALPQWQREEG